MHCPQGAQYQKPRKIPLRIEPKTYFGEASSSAARPLVRLPRSHSNPTPPRAPALPPTLSRPAANERTFLAWLSMATTLGTVSTAISGFAVADEEAQARGGISQSTVELITLTMLPISIAMIAYALFTFYWRSEFMRRKQIGFFDDKVGGWVGGWVDAGVWGGGGTGRGCACMHAVLER